MKRSELLATAAALFLSAFPLRATVVTWQELINTPRPAEGLLEDPAKFADIVPPRAVPAEGLRFFTEMVRDLYATLAETPKSYYFFCTIYYTPLETGFDAARGFDMTPKTMKGSGGRKFPADFIR